MDRVTLSSANVCNKRQENVLHIPDNASYQTSVCTLTRVYSF